MPKKKTLSKAERQRRKRDSAKRYYLKNKQAVTERAKLHMRRYRQRDSEHALMEYRRRAREREVLKAKRIIAAGGSRMHAQWQRRGTRSSRQDRDHGNSEGDLIDGLEVEDEDGAIMADRENEGYDEETHTSDLDETMSGSPPSDHPSPFCSDGETGIAHRPSSGNPSLVRRPKSSIFAGLPPVCPPTQSDEEHELPVSSWSDDESSVPGKAPSMFDGLPPSSSPTESDGEQDLPTLQYSNKGRRPALAGAGSRCSMFEGLPPSSPPSDSDDENELPYASSEDW